MQTIELEAEAGDISKELALRGIGAHTRVHVTVEIDDEQNVLPMTIIAHQGRAFDWLSDEPELYTDADLVKRTP